MDNENITFDTNHAHHFAYRGLQPQSSLFRVVSVKHTELFLTLFVHAMTNKWNFPKTERTKKIRIRYVILGSLPW